MTPPSEEQSSGNKFWRDQARRYDRAVGQLNRRFDEMACQVADTLQGSGEVLEVATGTGLVPQRLAPKIGRLVATDMSANMLSVLGARIGDAGHTNVEIRKVDAEALSLEDGMFDAVVIANLLHPLPRPAVALQEARRVLRVQGVQCALQSVSRLTFAEALGSCCVCDADRVDGGCRGHLSGRHDRTDTSSVLEVAQSPSSSGPVTHCVAVPLRPEDDIPTRDGVTAIAVRDGTAMSEHGAALRGEHRIEVVGRCFVAFAAVS